MANLLKDRRALIFLSDDGLGEAAAACFRAEGAKVFTAGPGGDISYTATPKEIDKVFSAAVKTLGGLDTVVNVYTDWWVGNPSDIQDSTWEELSKANAATAVAISRKTLETIKGPGSLINVSNIWAFGTSAEMGVVGASKAVLGPLTKAVALQGAKRGLSAKLVAVGIVDSPAFRAIVSERAQAVGTDVEGTFEREVSRVAMQRAGKPDEVAKSIAYLASEHAAKINGVTIVVDGGLLHV